MDMKYDTTACDNIKPNPCIDSIGNSLGCHIISVRHWLMVVHQQYSVFKFPLCIPENAKEVEDFHFKGTVDGRAHKRRVCE